MNEQQMVDVLTKRVLASASEAIAIAVGEAFRAGEASAKQKVLAAIGGGEQQPAMVTSPKQISEPDEDVRRAPRGLTKEVVVGVLSQNPAGLALEQVQSAAVSTDRRVAEKTVYNELMRGRMHEYRLVEGRWYLAKFAPQVSFVPQKSEEPT